MGAGRFLCASANVCEREGHTHTHTHKSSLKGVEGSMGDSGAMVNGDNEQVSR